MYDCPGPNLARTENRALKRGGQAPAITIVGRDAKTLSGWIGNSTDWCRNLKMNESVEECIEEHTYSRSSVLKDVFWGFNTNPYHQQSILNESLVKEDFTMHNVLFVDFDSSVSKIAPGVCYRAIL